MNLKVLISALIALNLQAGKVNQSVQEETFLLLNALTTNSTQEQCEIYKKLYSDTKNDEYLLESIRKCYAIKDPETIKFIKSGDEKLANNPLFLQIKIAYLIDVGDIKQAMEVAKNLIKLSKTEQNYLILSSIYAHVENYEEALKTLKEAYALNMKNSDNVLRIAAILLDKLGRESDAIEFL